MPELRWALLVVGMLFLVGLAWWEMRRPRRGLPRADAPLERHGEVRQHRQEPSLDQAPSQRGLHAALEPDFELPRIHTHVSQDTESEELRDAAVADGFDATTPVAASASESVPAGEQSRPRWPQESQRRIVALRVVPPPPGRFGGRTVRQALEDSGFVHGDMGIFHRSQADGQVLCSAANLTRPGSFEPESMDGQFFHGLNLFTVLPGALSPELAVDQLAASATEVAQRLDGLVQDDLGRALTGGRLAELRAAVDSAGPAA